MLSEEELERLEAPDPELARPDATLHQFQRDIDAAEKAEADKAAAREQQIAEAKRKAEEAARLAAEQGKELKQTVNWGLAPAREVTLFYPGTSSIEWIFGREHGGSRAFSKGERCVGCHEKEAADMGKRIVTGEKLEPNVIPGKRGSIPVQIQAAHDDEHLYMRFSWPDTDHAPTPFVEGGKMDPDNKVKLAMMFGTDDVEFAEGAGCWASCHTDSRDMPGEVDNATIQTYAESGRLDTTEGITKYLEESRTEMEYKGRRGKEPGGWDKLKPEAEIQAAMQDNNFLDLIRYQIGTDTVEDGHVLAERNMDGGQGAEFNAQLEDGVWTVEMKRKLKSDSAGDLSLDLSRVYNIGFAIHDDYSDSRYHHISLGYRLGFDNDSEDIEINAVKL
ncbi:ethylbenzene dehydrogenase-related protein [Marinobacter halophilus]|nr:ethylbenzene dehydrogenase-related protein [Marinobacter halophilus]